MEGITKISKFDIDYAAQLGYVIKLVGLARPQGDEAAEVCVYPGVSVRPSSAILASV